MVDERETAVEAVGNRRKGGRDRRGGRDAGGGGSGGWSVQTVDEVFNDVKAKQMDLIDQFIARYQKEYDYYEQLARLCQQQCELRLEQSGIRAIVTSRAKTSRSLRGKVEKRQSNRGTSYGSLKEISDDIIDLAGVRIALYFPADRANVERLLNDLFVVIQPVKVFPDQSLQKDRKYPNRFSGYHARHYRVRLRENSLTDVDKRFAAGLIEVQVASVLMHAWAEVSHDLVYKPQSEDLSEAEYAMLDQLNGLVLSGETSLEALQRAQDSRVNQPNKSFANHYELASYIYERAEQPQAGAEDSVMGRVDVLFELLRRAGLNNPGDFRELEKVLSPVSAGQPVVQRYLDAILTSHPQLHELYAKLWREMREKHPYGPSEEPEVVANEKAAALLDVRCVRLLTLCISLWKTLRGEETAPSHWPVLLNGMASLGLITQADADYLADGWQLRAAASQGPTPVDTTLLNRMNDRIKQVVFQMKEKHPTPEVVALVDNTLRHMG